jgi:hypothetical protein
MKSEIYNNKNKQINNKNKSVTKVEEIDNYETEQT